jgi:hypothetical protein
MMHLFRGRRSSPGENWRGGRTAFELRPVTLSDVPEAKMVVVGGEKVSVSHRFDLTAARASDGLPPVTSGTVSEGLGHCAFCPDTLQFAKRRRLLSIRGSSFVISI